MFPNIVTSAYDFTPPKAAASTTGDMHVLNTVATTTRIQIPANWKDSWVTFQAEGLDVWLAFGSSSVTVSKTQVSSVASEVMTSVATNAFHIPAGTSRDFHFTDADHANAVTHFAHISADTTGFLRMARTTGS